MPIKLFEFQENFMIGTLLTKLTQFKKTGSIQSFYSAGKSTFEKKSSFETRSRSCFFAVFKRSYVGKPIYVNSADELQLHSKSAYIPKCIH